MCILTKDFLVEQYQILGKSIREISKEINTHPSTISKKLNFFNIPKRTCGTRKGKPNKNISIRKDDIVIGSKYNLLTVKEVVRGGLLCICDCGNKKVLSSTRIRLNQVKSCGCLLKKTGEKHHFFKGYKEISQSVFNKIRQKAQDRNIKFEINIKDIYDLYIKQSKRCAISGIKIKFKKNSKDEQTASLDRIDSSKHYSIENIQWVHKKINTMKWNLSQEEFINYCKIIAKHNT